MNSREPQCCRIPNEEIEDALEVIDGLLRYVEPEFLIVTRCLDSILKRAGRLQKQEPDLTTPDGFLEWVITLALDLRLAERIAIERRVDEIIPILNSNWPGMTQAQITATLAELVELILSIREDALALQIPFLEFAASEVTEGAMDDWTARYALGIIPTLAPRDLEMEQYLVNSTVNFIRARDGRIAPELSTKAREVVRDGLSRGLGRNEIGQMLQESLGAIQTPTYYNLIAGQFVNRARSYGALRSMQQAGIGLAEIVAVLDERTTEICRFLNGRYIRVDDSIDLLNRMEESDDPEAVKEINPWIREGRDEDGKFLYVEKPDGTVTRIADVTRSGVGNVDDPGEFSNTMNSDELMVLGIGPPPYHAFCRSTLVPAIEELVV